MSANIEIRIAQAKYEYQSRTHLEDVPHKLFVGQRESKELLERAEFHLGIKFYKATVDGKRLQYQGMKVYVVDEESYLWCAP